MRGAWWRQIDDHPFTTDALYGGVAGVVLPLVTLAEMTGDARYATAARRAVRHLVDAAVPDGAGLTWDVAWDDREERVHHARFPGLYDGVTGIAWTLLTYGDARDDAEALAAGRRGLDAVVARLGPLAGGPSGTFVPGGALDVIAGSAGVVLALLDGHRVTGEGSYRDAAVAAADGLLAAAERTPQGWRWPSRIGGDRVYTGFSHGVAGIATALAQTYAATGEARFLAAAQEGARWLATTDLCVHDARGTAWRHDTTSSPDDRLWEGWCHGPAGTCRLHLLLYSLTGDPRALAVAEDGARYLLAATDPTKDRAASGFWAPSLCCGAAGVGTFLLDLARVTGNPAYTTHAAAIVGFLERTATRPTTDQACWSLSGQPEGKHGKLWHGTNLMTGQGGYVTFLGRFAQERHRLVREVLLPPDLAVPCAAPGARLLVAEVGSAAGKDGAAFHRSVRRLASYRGGAWVRLPDAPSADAVRDVVRAAHADALAIVAAPATIDANLHRRVLDGVARVDDDVFPDATWGYLTGADPDDVRAMLDRMGEVERDGLRPRAVALGIAHVDDLVAYPSTTEDGLTSTSVYLPTTDRRPDVRARVPAFLAHARGAGFVNFSGNGDPMRVWLFPDARNADPAQHWPFDPRRVVRDPSAAGLEGIGAAEFAGWDVTGAVLQFTTCHAGVPRHAVVAPDIVSTFGATGDVVRFYDLAPRESLCLTLLARAPAALLAPIGPNHGALGLVEACRLRWEDLTIGEAVRRGQVDVALHWRTAGRIPLVQWEDGRPDPAPRVPGNVMREGTLNRAVFGDPTFRPFAGMSPRRGSLRVTRAPTTDGFGATFTVQIERPTTLEDWNPYAGSEAAGDRLVAALPLAVGDGAPLTVTLRPLAPRLPAIARASWTVERRRAAPAVLHVMLEAPRRPLPAPSALWDAGGGYVSSPRSCGVWALWVRPLRARRTSSA